METLAKDWLSQWLNITQGIRRHQKKLGSEVIVGYYGDIFDFVVFVNHRALLRYAICTIFFSALLPIQFSFCIFHIALAKIAI